MAPSPSGKAADCKSAIPGSNPGGASRKSQCEKQLAATPCRTPLRGQRCFSQQFTKTFPAHLRREATPDQCAAFQREALRRPKNWRRKHPNRKKGGRGARGNLPRVEARGPRRRAVGGGPQDGERG